MWVFGGGDGTFGGGEEGGDVEEISSQMDFVGFIGTRGLWSIEKGEVFQAVTANFPRHRRRQLASAQVSRQDGRVNHTTFPLR